MKMANEKRRLIDANSLILAIRDDAEIVGKHYARIKMHINGAPTVDAVEVVRCKDCNYFGGHGMCYCHAADEHGTPIFVREDDFCSYGERRTDNENP